jgi:hypothetical protein
MLRWSHVLAHLLFEAGAARRDAQSFNGKLRDELLDREIFHPPYEAKVLIERWRQHYNRVRPHSARGSLLLAPGAVQLPPDDPDSPPRRPRVGPLPLLRPLGLCPRPGQGLW